MVKRVLFVMTAAVLLLIAQVGAASACMSGYYEPDVPEAMK